MTQADDIVVDTLDVRQEWRRRFHHGIAGRQIGHVRFRVWLKEHNVTDRDADGDAYDKRRED